MSAEAGVGHCVTLLSTAGFRRAAGAELPSPDERGVPTRRVVRRIRTSGCSATTCERIPAFLAGAAMPECRAGVQSFNIDHVGNVSHCIEKIDRPFGNVRRERADRRFTGAWRAVESGARLPGLLDGLPRLQPGAGRGRHVRTAWRDLALRMRSV